VWRRESERACIVDEPSARAAEQALNRGARADDTAPRWFDAGSLRKQQGGAMEMGLPTDRQARLSILPGFPSGLVDRPGHGIDLSLLGLATCNAQEEGGGASPARNP